jgi:hypothetical protein
MESKIFYSFMGMNLVTEGGVDRAKFFPPGAMGAIPGMTTLPAGMMKRKIEQANIPSLADLQEMAQIEGMETRGPVYYIGFDRNILMSLRDKESATLPVRVPGGVVEVIK